MLFTPYSMTKLFEFQDGYVTGTMVSMDMSEILRVLWEVRILPNCMSWQTEVVLSNVYRIAIVVYHECSTLRLYSTYLGNSRPTAANSFVWGPMLMDLEYILTIIVKVSKSKRLKITVVIPHPFFPITSPRKL